ncbi:hypothetical protein DY000_02062467 [Brassica cretica]|uniref:Late embryogenesis abundant protein LEA-2 subgroup domain-containing protein n=1 Tax=Brassica cretica TaxID=69181 RepID=A0ABQ7AUV0_BRACR|nr:hypothetical protein DY000_02062467 [Brassica cretica]
MTRSSDTQVGHSHDDDEKRSFLSLVTTSLWKEHPVTTNNNHTTRFKISSQKGLLLFTILLFTILFFMILIFTILYKSVVPFSNAAKSIDARRGSLVYFLGPAYEDDCDSNNGDTHEDDEKRSSLSLVTMSLWKEHPVTTNNNHTIRFKISSQKMPSTPHDSPLHDSPLHDSPLHYFHLHDLYK